MATPLRVPGQYAEGFAKIRDLGDESAQELLAALQEAPPNYNESSLSSAVAEVVDTIAASDIMELVSALLSLYSYRDYSQSAISDVTEGIAQAMEESRSERLRLSPEERPRFEERLAKLLDTSSYIPKFDGDADEYPDTLDLADEPIERLRELYEFKDRATIEGLLRENSFLFDLLETAHYRIQEYFGSDTSVALDVLREPDAKNSGRLFILILTALRPKEAVARLDELDRGWWFGVLSAARGKLTIDIDYG